MSKYIIDELGEKVLSGATVLELGSGPGLCALVAQKWASKMVLSDYQDLVMDLIAINIKDTEPLAPTCQLMSTQLDWMKSSEPQYYETLPVLVNDAIQESLKQICTLSEMKFDYIIGSDIVYWPTSIQPLMNVLKTLFIRNKETLKAFYFCYIERTTSTHKLLREGILTTGLDEFGGFKLEIVGDELAKSIDKDAVIYKVTIKQE